MRNVFSLIAALLLAGCSDSEFEPKLTRDDVEQLAKEMHVTIGDTLLVLPRIAVANREGLKQFPAAGGARDRLEIFVGPYGWSDWEPEVRKICPMLARRWVASVCDDPWSPIEQAMPTNSFYLIDRDAIVLFDNHWTVGGERIGDQLRAMRFEVGRTAIRCDREKRSGSRFCTAALGISPRVVAVWSVWDGPQEDEEAMARREGAAIAAFVRYAISPEEDFAALLPVMCSARRPGASNNGPPRGDRCEV